ncbi:MAG TPA: hypothetical protein VLG50_00830 [Candidatus Saccharimonadales bacterium]|nr:hypothetical protein [Candidatus Saccharimonadales bacterium]
MKKLLFLISLLVYINQPAFAQDQHDAYAAIRYNAAFDQEALYKKHADLMQKLGCANNVFPAQKTDDLMDQPHTTNASHEEVNASHNKHGIAPEEIAAYEKECLSQLHHARFMALAKPGINAAIEMTVVTSACFAIFFAMKYFIEKDKPSFAGGFAALDGLYTAAFKGKEIIQTMYNVKYAPDNFLSLLEEHFAKNKCYIPRVLWPQIIKAFISARHNEMSREKHVNFLNFTLGLTLYKPKNAIIFKHNKAALDIKHELNNRIDRFFADYEQSTSTDSLYHIKINVSKFVDSLLTPQSPAPRYMYLHGMGGIGKTHFVQTLAQWISDLIPNGVHFENVIINSYEELEGNETRPGVFLKVLRNQSIRNKTGSVVIIDEATWLNEYVSPAKRIFNGNLSKLSTVYFGSELDGSIVSLDMPPMLIFVASNEKINDSALASRFDIVDYPLPSKAALTAHAIETAQHSKILQERNCVFDDTMITSWVQNLDAKNLNFRYIAGNIEVYLLGKNANMCNQTH